jgi:osmotically-inducible protein OsmY
VRVARQWVCSLTHGTGLYASEQTVPRRRRTLAAPQQTGTSNMKTDAQLQQDVMAELKWEPSVHAAQIGVEVRDGVVTLAGEVGSYAEKWNAERAAQRVAGVKALAIEMKVKLPGLGGRTDADIAISAENVLRWANFLPLGSIKVQVESGWITLTGDVEWQYQRQEAADSMRYLLGVTGVSNQIGIKHTLSAGIVKADIESALKRRAEADSKTIAVEVKGADVTLTGTVHSWAEREVARHSAWSTSGVRNVVDKMTLVN